MGALWRALAQVTVALHFAFLAYVVVGGVVAWRWRRTIWVHVVAAAWGLLIVLVRVPCPLTAAQNALREAGGQPPLRSGFIGTYVTGVLYPAGAQRWVQLAVGAVVLASWAGYLWRGATRGGRSAERPHGPQPLPGRPVAGGRR